MPGDKDRINESVHPLQKRWPWRQKATSTPSFLAHIEKIIAHTVAVKTSNMSFPNKNQFNLT